MGNDYKVRFTFSELSAFRKCRAFWDLSYRQGFTRKVTSPPLALGSLIHATLAEFYAGKKPDECLNYFDTSSRNSLADLRQEYPELDIDIEKLEFHLNLGTAMLKAYFDFASKNDAFKVLKPEQSFVIPVVTPSGNNSNKFEYAGKCDGLLEYLGKTWIHEIKTSSNWSEKDVETLQIDPQIQGYIWGAGEYFKTPIAGAIYSCIKKCQLRLKKNETVEELRKRIVEDYTSRPDFYVSRHFVYFNKSDIDNTKAAIYEQCKDMSDPFIYKNVGKPTCGFGCTFRTYCVQQSEEILNMYYRKKTKKHEELEEPGENQEELPF